MRLKNHADGTTANMLVLTDDDKSSTSTYGAQVGGRVKASQFYVGEADTRAHTSQGVYVGQDGSSVGYFNINKGASGTGGFKFGTYAADGTLAQSNLELAADGSVKIDKYKATTNDADSETNAIASFDANGNLVRNYQQNARLRSIEERTDGSRDGDDPDGAGQGEPDHRPHQRPEVLLERHRVARDQRPADAVRPVNFLFLE
jgi:hypothetical protein